MSNPSSSPNAIQRLEFVNNIQEMMKIKDAPKTKGYISSINLVISKEDSKIIDSLEITLFEERAQSSEQQLLIVVRVFNRDARGPSCFRFCCLRQDVIKLAALSTLSLLGSNLAKHC